MPYLSKKYRGQSTSLVVAVVWMAKQDQPGFVWQESIQCYVPWAPGDMKLP